MDRTAGVRLTSPNGRMVLTSYGDHGVLSGAIDGQIVSNSFTLNLSTSVIAERARATQGNKCAVPKLESPFTTVDPFGRPYARIIANYTRDLFNCENTVSEYTRSGVKINRLIQNMSLATNPDFWIATAYEFSESDLVEQPSMNTTFTRGIPYEYHWRYAKNCKTPYREEFFHFALTSCFRSPDRLKVTREFNTFPWSAPEASNNGSSSFISIHFEVSLAFPAGSGYFNYNDTTILSYSSKIGTNNHFLYFEFENCWLVDNVPVCSYLPSSSAWNQTLNYAQDVPLSTFRMGQSLCSDHVGHWNSAIYDPQLATLFSLDPVNQQPSPGGKTKAWPIIVGVVAGVVVAAVIIVIIVFLAMKHADSAATKKQMAARL